MTKTELLERLETLKDEQGARACLGCHYIKPECEKTCMVIEEAIKAIKADEGEERHGRWINFYGDYSVAECSICEEVFDAIQPREYNNPEWWNVFLREYRYCPKCGARMDSEKAGKGAKKWRINAQELLDELAVAESELKTEVEQQYEECVELVFEEVRQVILNCKRSETND